MNASDVLIYILVLLRLVIAVKLTQVARQNNMQNLVWLAIVFYAGAVFNIFSTTSLNTPILFRLGLGIAQICIVIFVARTFYQGKESPFRIFMGAAILLSVVGLTLTWLALNRVLPPLYDLIGNGALSILILVSYGWHAWVANQALAAVASDSHVEDWVKARYRMMIAYCALAGIAAPLVFLVPIVGSAAVGVVALVVIFGVALQFLVWIMPESFRVFLNRNYKAPVAAAYVDLSEEELMRQLKAR